MYTHFPSRTGTESPACIVSGYPVLNNKIEFLNHGLVAIKEEWNKFIMVAKTVSDPEIQDMMKFFGAWGGMGQGAPSFSFQ